MTDPVHDFFTSPEETRRPVYERALQKTQLEQQRMSKDNTAEEIKTEFKMFVPDDDGSAMDWLENRLAEAHQAGIDEAVAIMEKIKIKNQNYIDGLAPREMNYENPRFIESKGIIQALDDTIEALQDNK